MPRGLTSPPLRLTCARYGCDKQFYSYPNRRGTEGKYQKFCCRACYLEQRRFELASQRRQREREQAAATKLVRVPAKFFDDHDGRECEPFCTPVKRSSRFVWLKVGDVGLAELLDDAKHYADEWGPDEIGDNGGLRRSAAATVKAIEAALASS